MTARAAAPLFLALLAACSGDSGPPETGRGASLVLIVVDTLRADHADPAAGRAATPAIDALAADGVRFPLCLSHAPATLPAHASLFSSRHPYETGVRVNGQLVPAELPLLAPWLARHGYESLAAVSLATLWPTPSGPALERGFERYAHDGTRDCTPADQVNAALAPLLDEIESLPGGERRPFFLFAHYSDPHDPYDAHGSRRLDVGILLDGEPLETLNASEFAFRQGAVTLAPGPHSLELSAEAPFRVRMVEPRGPAGLLPATWVEGKPHQPVTQAALQVENPLDAPVACDLWLWLQDDPDPAECARRYELEVEFADRQIGLFLGELKRRGLYEGSLVVLTSDHGEALGEHGHVGHVVNLYDELLRVPLIVKPPAGHRSTPRLRVVSRRLARQVDLAPTILELLDLPALPGQRGISLLEGRPQPLLAETHRPLAPRDLLCLRDERFKLVYEPARDRFELYDLAADPRELADLFAERGRETAAWQETLRKTAEAAAKAPELDPAMERRIRALGY